MSLVTIPRDNEGPEERDLKHIADAIKSIRYGSVLAVIQNGRLVQIEVKEKRRFDLAGNGKNKQAREVN
jgi:hypothetical protein